MYPNSISRLQILSHLDSLATICCISHIQAAYASFLWDTEDEDENEEDEERNYQIGHPAFHHGFVASAATA